MKKIYNIILSAAVLAFAGCADDNTETPGPSPKEYEIKIIAGAPETKAYWTGETTPGMPNVTWQRRDRIGIFTGGTAGSAGYLQTDDLDGFKVVFTGSISGEIQDGQTLYAYYSGGRSFSADAIENSVIRMSTQYQGYASGVTGCGPVSLPLVAKKTITNAGDSPEFEMTFHNLYAVLQIPVKKSAAKAANNVTITSIAVSGRNGEQLTGDLYVDMTGDTPVITGISDGDMGTSIEIGGGSFSYDLSTTDPVMLCIGVPSIEFRNGITVRIGYADDSVESGITQYVSHNAYGGGKTFEPKVYQLPEIVYDGITKITSPTLNINDKSHSKITVGWDYVAEWASPANRRFNVRIYETATPANSREYAVNVADTEKYKFNRYTFAGLKADTEYTCEVTLVSNSNSTLQNSDPATITATTDAAPALPANTVLYQDFSNFWYGADPIWAAFGKTISGSDALSFDPANEYTYTLVPYYAQDRGWDNTQLTAPNFFVPGGGAALVNDAFRNHRWDNNVDASTGWHGANVYEAAGYVLIGREGATGTGSLITPPFGSAMGGSGTVMISLKTCPYTEPYSNGSLAYDKDGTSAISGFEESPIFELVATGGGQFFVNGNPAGSVTLSNTLNSSVAQAAGNDLDHLGWTTNEVELSGATADTRIRVQTLGGGHEYPMDSGKYYECSRMWLSEIKVVKQ